MMKSLKYGSAVLAAVIAGVFLDYTLPQVDVVKVTSIQNKVMGSGSDKHDLYLIFAETVDDAEPMVYRNEDTGWGWPPYFKFNTADVQQRAGSLANKGATVAVTNYGWRLRMFSTFPNAVSVREVPADYTHFPVFNVMLLTVLAGLIALAYVRVKRVARDLLGADEPQDSVSEVVIPVSAVDAWASDERK